MGRILNLSREGLWEALCLGLAVWAGDYFLNNPFRAKQVEWPHGSSTISKLKFPRRLQKQRRQLQSWIGICSTYDPLRQPYSRSRNYLSNKRLIFNMVTYWGRVEIYVTCFDNWFYNSTRKGKETANVIGTNNLSFTLNFTWDK